MINLVSGRVTCGSMILEPATRIEAILSTPELQATAPVAAATHCDLGVHHCDGRDWGVEAVFQGQRLGKVLLRILGKDEREASPDPEEPCQQADEDFLESLFRVPPPGKHFRHNFAWGSVESKLDRSGIRALIVVSYKQV